MTARFASPRTLRHATVASCTALAFLAPALAGVASAAPGTPAPLFTSSRDTAAFMLAPRDVAAIVKAPGLHADVVTASMPDSSGRVDPAGCVVAFQPAEATVHPDALRAITRTQHDGAPRQDPTVLVTQSIMDFDDDAAAHRGFDAASAEWARCGARSVTVQSRRGQPASWRMGAPALRGDGRVLAATNDGPGVTCERAMTVRQKLIVDVRVCDFAAGDAGALAAGPTGQAAAIAAAIGDHADRGQTAP